MAATGMQLAKWPKTYSKEELSKINIKETICSCCLNKIDKTYRYKCLICHNYFLCSECFEHQYTSVPHLNVHAVVRILNDQHPTVLFDKEYASLEALNIQNFWNDFKQEIHDENECFICKMEQIEGVRFKSESGGQAFSLCFRCYQEEYLQKCEQKSNDRTFVAIGKSKLNNKIDQFEILDKLGRGTFGHVNECLIKPSNLKAACKVIVIDDSILGNNFVLLRQSFLRERIAYEEIKGENIVRSYGSYDECDENTNTIKYYLFMELMELGNLASLLKNEPDMSLEKRLNMAIGISSGMARIHDLGFIHRDIQPQNILISRDYTPKIGDMGIAKIFENNQLNTLVGNGPYMPPEFHQNNYDIKLDIFTFGLTMVELFGGKHECVKKRVKVIKQPENLWSTIEPCVDNDPSNRPTARTIEKMLKIERQLRISSENKIFEGKSSGFTLEKKSISLTRLDKDSSESKSFIKNTLSRMMGKKLKL